MYKAVALESQVHASTSRMGTVIPYLAHVMGASAAVMEAGGDDESVAALLHDTLEDGRDSSSLRARTNTEFGPRVRFRSALMRENG